MNTFARSIAAFAAVAVLVLAVRDAKASGFAIKENSTEALGTAFAGAASSGTFLSTIFNNPAGMTQLTGEHAQLDASLIFPSVRFSGTATANCPACGAGGTPITGSGNAGQAAFVPAGYVLYSAERRTRSAARPCSRHAVA